MSSCYGSRSHKIPLSSIDSCKIFYMGSTFIVIDAAVVTILSDVRLYAHMRINVVVPSWVAVRLQRKRRKWKMLEEKKNWKLRTNLESLEEVLMSQRKNMQVFRARLERCISESDRLELFSVTPYICNQICGKIRHFGFVSNERAFHTLSFLQLKSTVQKLTSFQSCLRGKLQKQLTGWTGLKTNYEINFEKKSFIVISEPMSLSI